MPGGMSSTLKRLHFALQWDNSDVFSLVERGCISTSEYLKRCIDNLFSMDWRQKEVLGGSCRGPRKRDLTRAVALQGK